MFHARSAACSAWAAALAAAACVSGQTIEGIGFLPGGSFSLATSLTDDGAAGYSNSPTGYRAARWTPGDGLVPLGVLEGGGNSYALGAAGGFIAGWSESGSGDRAILWSADLGLIDLGVLEGGTFSSARAVSASGVAVGVADTPTGQRAFRWSASGGMDSLGVLAGAAASAARAVSADGTVIAGSSGLRAFRWESGVMEELPPLPGGAFAFASGVSPDGSVIVGVGDAPGQPERAIAWTGGGPINLGTIAGLPYSNALAASDAGAAVVGACLSDSDSTAFLWTAELGMVDLNAYLPTVGVDLTGWRLVSAEAVSPDGGRIAGRGIRDGRVEGWVVLLARPCSADFNGDGQVDFFDYLDFVNAFANEDPSADFNGDGQIDFFDYLDFVNAFAAGCD